MAIAKDNDYTVGHLIRLLKKYPPDTMFSIEDMDGNAYYSNCISEHLDSDTPSVELIIPIYPRVLSIEPGNEDDVFIYNSEVNVLGEDD